MVDQKTAYQEWVNHRIQAVDSKYSIYDILLENGIELADQFTDLQISCPFHKDQRPSARYYGSRNGHFHCYSCKTHANNSITLYAKFRHLEFMPALKELERRFGIKISRKPDVLDREEPTDKISSEYKSHAWNDIPRLLQILENKLLRIRDHTSLIDYAKFCRVLDVVQWDFDKNQNQATPAMIEILKKLRKKMDEISNLEIIE